MFLLHDPGESYQVFNEEIDAVSAAMTIISKYRDDCGRTGEWDESVAGVSVYILPPDVTTEDCADYGIGESGCQLLWQSVESGDDTEGYDYRIERKSAKSAGGASE